jgi:hypothetical protein
LINVSEQLKEESKKNHNYYVTANVTLADGTKLSLEKKDFYLDGNGIIDAADSSDFPVGVAIEKTATLSLVNDKEQFDKYSFNKAVFVIFMNLQLSDRLETFKRGSFIVCKKPVIDGEISLTLLDYMSKADLTYKTNLSFPCTAREVLEDACQQSGIVLGDAEFPNSDYQVNKAPENTTFRAVIGMVAALAGGNARIDEDDLLRIVTFDQKEIHHELSAVSDVQVDTDPVVITGIKYTEGDDSYLYGTEGYVLELKENQLLSGNAEDGVKRIGQILNGFEIMPFSLSHPPMGYLTFGDTVHFKDSRGIEHTTYATEVEFKFADSLELACNAKSVEEQEAEFPGGGQSQIIVEQVNKAVDKKMTAYDIKLKQANELAANCLGFWYTEVTLEDGSVIAYRHNKPKLEESKIVYKNAAEGSFVTNDYQGTDEATTQAGKWNAAFDSNGDAVLNILYAIGIQAGWINTRGFTAKDNDGNITFRINETTGDVEIDADNFFLGKTSLSDRLEDMENTIASGKNLSMLLDNDYQSIPVDANGNVIGEFPSVQTTVMVKYGTEDITSDCSFKVSTSDGVEGVWEKDLHTYTVTKLSADSAWIEFRATYLQTLSLSKKFKVSKLYAGKDGGKGIPGTNGEDGKTSYLHIAYANSADGKTGFSKSDSTGKIYIGQYTDYAEDDSSNPAKYKWTRIKGEDGRTYFIELSANAVKRGQDNLIVPETITASAYYRDGTNASRVAYSGRWKIQTSTDGTTWKNVYTSSSNESTKTWTLKNFSKDIVSIRFVLYAAGGTTQTIDMQTIPVLVDVAALTHEEIFDLLTDSGKVKGLYKIGNQLYVSFSYARGGELALGGKNNDNGVQKIYDADGNVIVTSDTNGITIYNTEGTPKARMSNKGTVYFKEYYENGDTLQYKGIAIGDMNGFDDNIDPGECGIKVIDYNRIGDVSIVDTSGNGFTYETDGLVGTLYKLEVAQITDVTEFQKPPKILNCKHVSSGGHLVFAKDGATVAYLSSSSERYKDVQKNLECMEQWYDIEPVWAKYKDGYLTEGDAFNGKDMPMFLAEDVEKHMPEAAVYNKDGKIEDWNYRVMIPAMFAMLKEQHQEIEELKKYLKRT